MSGGDRVPCAVLGCGESRGLRRQDRGVLPAAWICGACWDEVPEATRADYRHLQRRERREADRHGVPPAELAARADIAFARCAAAAGFRCEAA